MCLLHCAGPGPRWVPHVRLQNEQENEPLTADGRLRAGEHLGGSWKFLRSDLQLRPEHRCDTQEDSLEEAAQSRTGRLLQSGGPVLLCRVHHGAVYTEVHLSEMKLQPSLSAHQPHLRRQGLHITGGAVLDTPSITGSSVGRFCV